MSGSPPFPKDIPCHPLLSIDYALLKDGDAHEADKLWQAATQLGFWSMYNHGAEEDVDMMYNISKKTLSLPMEEKLKFDQGSAGSSHGFKPAGSWQIDEKGHPDSAEFMNVSADDTFAYPKVVHRTYPSVVNDHMDPIARYMRKALDIDYVLLEAFDEKLGMPRGTLRKKHNEGEESGTEVRYIRNPPRKEKLAHIAPHTDFGTLTLVHNRIGGLQVLVPESDTWKYIEPIPGHIICNVGDMLTMLSGGVLRSNLHRVIPLPDQADIERWSLAFLLRPGTSTILRPLFSESEIIKKATGGKEDPGCTAGEWFSRRIRNHHIVNRKGTGKEAWLATRGTEHSTRAN